MTVRWALRWSDWFQANKRELTIPDLLNAFREHGRDAAQN